MNTMSHEENTSQDQLHEQLALYREIVEYYRHKEKLIMSIGTTDANLIVSMVQSMEEQLKDFYATKDVDHPDHLNNDTDSAALSAELGTSNAQEIISMVKNMEEQLKDFYAKGDQDHPDFSAPVNVSSDIMKLKDELGTSNSDEIISMVKNMEDQLKDFYALKDEEVLSEDLPI